MRSLGLLLGAWIVSSACFVSCMTPQVMQAPLPEVADLKRGLEPLREAFNKGADRPRLLALVPQSCADSLDALRRARQEAEDSGHDILWLVVWQDEMPGDDCQLARAAGGSVDAEDTLFFHDCERLAARGLAGGAILSGQLSRAYLFYPPGVKWGDSAPKPSTWVHRMGRLGPDQRGGLGRLTEDLRQRWAVLAMPR